MLKLSLRSVWSHKRRLFGTFFAVFLGVAFLTGTQVLSATLKAGINDFFVTANAGTDLVVRNAAQVTDQPGTLRGGISADLVQKVGQTSGVAEALPVITGYGEIVGSDGTLVTGNGPRQAGTWLTDPALNPYRTAEGRAPAADNEVVIDRGSAKKGHLKVGDTTTVLTPQPVPVTVVGIVTFGSQDSYGQSSFTGFTEAGAQKYVNKQPGTVSSISVRVQPGLSRDELKRAVQAAMPQGVQVITGDELTAEDQDGVSNSFLKFFKIFLTVFAVVALLVATFSIHNTFSVLAAQRAKDSALMRAVGATRRQVLSMVVIEAMLVGVVASVVGLLGGIGIAALLKGAFAGFGITLPTTSLVLSTAAVATALPVGIVVTIIAGITPALQSSRVSPVAALSSVAFERTGLTRRRAIIGAAAALLGVGAVLAGAVSGSSSTLGFAGLGAILLLVGMVVLGPTAARPVSRVIGAGLAKVRGFPGSLASQNAQRNPRRTAGASAALMIGVGVVTMITVLAGSFTKSLDRSMSQAFAGDLVVNSGGFAGQSGFGADLPEALGTLPQVADSVGIGTGTVLLDGASSRVTVAEPARVAAVFDLHLVTGNVGTLGAGQVAVTEDTAKDNGLTLGSTVPVTFPDGTRTALSVAAVYAKNQLLGSYLVPTAAWSPHAPTTLSSAIYVKLAGGVSLADGKAAVQRAVKPFGAPKVQDRAEFVSLATGAVSQLLGLVYVLLALAVIIALLGITNTLSLAVYERTREIGLLRAVGATRRQVRSMIRGESVITALLGTTAGLVLGAFLGWALVAAARSSVGVFALPAGHLVTILVVGGIAGVLAGWRPARRASRLNVLAAIATE